MARKPKTNRVVVAKVRAKRVIDNARARAKQLLDNARARAKQLLDNARARAKRIIDDAKLKKSKRPVKRQAKQPMKKSTSEETLLESLRKVAGKSEGLISVAPVRKESKLSKIDFDRAALQLSKANRIVLHEHDFPSSLTKSTRARLVEDGRGRVFVGMALYAKPESGSELLLELARKHGTGKAVRISELRTESKLFKNEFDEALRWLHEGGKVMLYRDDNRVTADDRGAYLIAGEPRHILYVR
jgi:hypothetical protein